MPISLVRQATVGGLLAMVLVGGAGLGLLEVPPSPRAAGLAHVPICHARGVYTRKPGRSEPFRTPAGVRVSVVAPSDYDPSRAYGLLVAYPPAGYVAEDAEGFYGLTEAATASGWIVAFPDHVPLSRRGIAAQSQVPEAVAARWCIDPARVALLGHSDGGTVAEGVALLARRAALPPTVIVASAAGIAGPDLQREGCPPVAPDVLILHNRQDARFPDYGAQAARFWAACLHAPAPAAMPETGACAQTRSVATARRLAYCAVPEPHERVHDLTTYALGFLNQAEARND